MPAYFFWFFFFLFRLLPFHTHTMGLQISDENRPSHCFLSVRTTVMILAGKYSVVVRTILRGRTLSTGAPPPPQ